MVQFHSIVLIDRLLIIPRCSFTIDLMTTIIDGKGHVIMSSTFLFLKIKDLLMRPKLHDKSLLSFILYLFRMKNTKSL